MFTWIRGWGDGGAERGRYADFLDEAAILLKKPKLKSAAALFRQSHAARKGLGEIALPDEVKELKEARELINRRGTLFIEQGEAALKEIERINKRLQKLREAASDHFPMTHAEVAALRQRMSEAVFNIHDLESKAVEAMQSALG